MKIYRRLWRRKVHRRQNHFVNLFTGKGRSSQERIHKQNINKNHYKKRHSKRQKTKHNEISECEKYSDFGKFIFKKSLDFGRSIHAAEKMKVGETVLITQPFASAVQRQKSIPYCLTCHAIDVPNFITCKHCEMVFFCSLNCKRANSTHKFECGTHFHEIKQTDIKCAIQMVFEAMSIFDKFEDLCDFVYEAIENRDGIPSGIDTRLSRFDCILKLQPREFSTDQDVNEAREIVLITYEHIINIPAVKKYFKLELHEGNTFLKHFLAHNVSVITENGFRIALTENCDRILIYDRLSFFNHSCCPNLINLLDGNVMICVTVQRIQFGEQLFISYRPFEYESKVERQREMNFWNFECRCTRCEYPREIESHEISEANRLNKKQIENQLNKTNEWTPQIWAYALRYIEMLRKSR